MALNMQYNDSFVQYCKHDYNQPALTQLIIDGFLTMASIIFGTIGTIYSMTIIQKLNISKSLRLHLFCLCIWDILVLACSFCYYGLLSFLQMWGTQWQNYLGYFAYMLFCFQGPLSTAITGSSWTVVVIALTRYVAVSRPLQSNSLISLKRSRFIAIVTFLGAFLYTLPCYFELNIEKCIDRNKSRSAHVLFKLLANANYQLIYRTICYIIFVSLGPFLIILISSLHTIYLIQNRNHLAGTIGNEMSTSATSSSIPETFRLRSNSPRPQRVGRRQNKKAAVLMSILIVKYLSCYCLSTILMIAMSVCDRTFFTQLIIKFIVQCSNFLVVLNSATNFIVYALWRKSTKKTTKCKFPGEANPLLNVANNSNSSNSIINATFSEEDALMLVTTWKIVQEEKGCDFFVKLLKQLADKNVYLKQQLIISGNNTNLQKISSRIFQSMNNIIGEIEADPYNFSSSKIQLIGETHNHHGIYLTNDTFRNFKLFLMNEIAQQQQDKGGLNKECNSNYQSKQINAWNHFLCILIAEMKLGYLKASNSGGTHLVVSRHV